MKTRNALNGTIGAGLFAVALTASAIPVTAVTAQWSAPVPAGVTISGPGTGGSTTASWGDAVTSGGPNSSYVFTPAATPFDAPANSSSFALGTFVHNNFPVNGTWLDSIVLNLSATIGGSTYAFSFDFDHEETPNTVLPCSYPGPVNCSDRVTVSNESSSNEFVYDGATYSFSIVGFQVADALTSEFITTERASNAAQLIASITPVSTPIPEPLTLGLLGAGLLGVAVAGRARRSV